MDILIEPSLTPNGIGVGIDEFMIWALSPCCTQAIHNSAALDVEYKGWGCSSCLVELKLPIDGSGVWYKHSEADPAILFHVQTWTGWGSELTMSIDRDDAEE